MSGCMVDDVRTSPIHSGRVITRLHPDEHARAVQVLRASFAAIDPDQPVRLAKGTSNLFRPRSPALAGLDVSGLTGVLDVDPVSRIAQVQGMCTYETLVAATLPFGLMPLVVPQLRTITVGGAVTGLGIESTSFVHGLPHESVLDLDVIVGTGEVLRVEPTGEHAELFAAFPNSYGSLGYAVRLAVELRPIGEFVRTRILRFDDLDDLLEVVQSVCRDGAWDGEPVDGLDGVAFTPDEAYLVLATFAAEPRPGERPSDYTGSQIYYRSLQHRSADLLTAHDYLWRWDTDWFWCSAAFGAQHPVLRRIWPAGLRRSDVYHRIVRLENRWQVAARLDRRRGRPPRERVVQDVEIPVERTAEFLRWFDSEVGMRPVWLCPIRLREAAPAGARSWPLYPMAPGRIYVNVGFWGSVPIAVGGQDGDVNRAIETRVAADGGHKSLYSDVFYDRSTFDAAYGGAYYRAVKERYDPGGRFPRLYEKVVGR